MYVCTYVYRHKFYGTGSLFMGRTMQRCIHVCTCVYACVSVYITYGDSELLIDFNFQEFR